MAQNHKTTRGCGLKLFILFMQGAPGVDSILGWNAVKNKGLGAKQEYLKDKLRAAAKGEWEGI